VILFGVIAAAIVCVLFVPTAYALIARGTGSPKDVARKLEKEAAASQNSGSGVDDGLLKPAE